MHLVYGLLLLGVAMFKALTFHRTLAWVLATSSLTAMGLAGLSAPARADSETNLKPNWSKPVYSQRQNNSYFADFGARYDRSARWGSLNDELLDPKRSCELKSEYERMVRDHEMQAHHDLITIEGQKKHLDDMRGFGRKVVGEVRSTQVRERRDELKEFAENSPGAVRKPLQLMTAAAAIYYGQAAPMSVRITEGVGLSAHANGHEKRGNVQLSTPIVHGSFSVVGDAPEKRDPWGPEPADPIQREERYRVSISRELPIWELQSGLSYGSTTSRVSATLSKELVAISKDATRTIRFELGTSKHVLPHSASSPNGEESFRVLYDLRF